MEQSEMEEIRRAYLDLLIAHFCYICTCSDFESLISSTSGFRSDLSRALDD
jgi:hypothetical protein